MSSSETRFGGMRREHRWSTSSLDLTGSVEVRLAHYGHQVSMAFGDPSEESGLVSCHRRLPPRDQSSRSSTSSVIMRARGASRTSRPVSVTELT